VSNDGAGTDVSFGQRRYEMLLGEVTSTEGRRGPGHSMMSTVDSLCVCQGMGVLINDIGLPRTVGGARSRK
jgi:hypothetical protein